MIMTYICLHSFYLHIGRCISN